MNQLTEILTTADFKTLADSELVELIKSGETKAFDEIDNRYRSILNRFLLRFTISSESAEELTQRTLIRAFEMIKQLKSGDKIAGWLHRIAFRLTVAENRCKKNVSLEDSDEPLIYQLNQIDLDDEKQNIWRYVKETLSPEEYTILLFRYRDNMTLTNIAKKTGKKNCSVRVQLHRIRKKLQEGISKNLFLF